MSGLAEILLDAGFKISGSDRAESELTRKLSANKATVYIGQSAQNVTEDIDVFVYTAAIKPDHPEFAKAQSLNIPILSRAQLLGQMMKNYAHPVAISGTHGKTTVTSMVSEILMAANADPTLTVGGVLESLNGNFRIGHSQMFVTEACEYTNSFLSFFPKYAAILNVEEDHLDFFKDINDIRASFNKFAKLVPDDGVVVIGGDIEGKEEVLKDVKANIITFGKDSSSDYYPTEISHTKKGETVFMVNSPVFGNEEIVLKIPGIHNIYNALAAIALCDFLNIDRKVIKDTLAVFGNAKRRFEYKGELNGFTIIDDYAHHPSEIRATLTAVRDIPHKDVWCVFQPHTYTRTKALLTDFSKALSMADKVVLADIYAARETDNLGISSETLRDEISKLGTECYYFPSFKEIENFIKENCAPNDVLITMGAGDVVNIGEELLK